MDVGCASGVEPGSNTVSDAVETGSNTVSDTVNSSSTAPALVDMAKGGAEDGGAALASLVRH